MRVRVTFVSCCLTFCLLGLAGLDFTGRASADEPIDILSQYAIGYREYRVDLPTRDLCWESMRSYVVNADGANRTELAAELIRGAHSKTAFSSWSPDARTALIENAYTDQSGTYYYDMYTLDMVTGDTLNISAPERMSTYNGGASYWPGDPTKILGNASVNGVNVPFIMNTDGTNKQTFIDGTAGGHTYMPGISPDGTRIAYHTNYQLYLADADGSNAISINTGYGFEFAPQWSPDGQWVLFLAGTANVDCDPYLVQSDGTGLHKLADRNGYSGAVPIVDIYDYHDGSSDVPVFSPNGKIYYTAQFGDTVELMQATIDGTITQLTSSPTGTLNYHPTPSPDGDWLMYGMKPENGVRQMYIMPADGGDSIQITDVQPGSGAMFGHWSPVPVTEPFPPTQTPPDPAEVSSRGMTITNVTTGEVLFYDDFEDASSVGTAAAPDSSGDYDPYAARGSYSLLEGDNTPFQVVTGENAGPGAFQGNNYLRVYRDGGASSTQEAQANVSETPSTGDHINVRFMAYFPEAIDHLAIFKLRGDGLETDSQRAGARTGGETSPGSGCGIVLDLDGAATSLTYPVDAWHEWQFDYVIGEDTYTMTVDGVTSGPIDNTRRGGPGNVLGLGFWNGSGTGESFYLDSISQYSPPGDADDDGDVDEDDLAILAANWLQTIAGGYSVGDFDGDGDVDDVDATILAANWTGSTGNPSVPEPSVIIMFCGAMAVLLFGRRRHNRRFWLSKGFQR